MSIEAKIEVYRKLKIQLSEVKAAEMVMRLEIAQDLGVDSLKAGTSNFDYPSEGIRLKLIKKLNYKLDKETLEMIDLSDDEAACIKWTPELKLTPYRKVEDTVTLDQAISVTDATPSIEIELREFS